ncbi:MAG: YczE/YyaS/YitT family protein [Actinomycetes bacterium]
MRGAGSATDRPLTMRQRLVRLFGSWIAVGIGIPMILRAELGASPFDVLNTGLGEFAGWSFGLCFVVTSIVLFAAGRLMGARLGWACIAGTLIIGPLVDVVLAMIPEQERLAVRIPLMVAGILVIAVAICLVIPTELGPGPTEVLMLGLAARGLDVVPARWIRDGLPVVAGALMGGALGDGTVAWVLCMGPLVKWGLRRLGYVPPRLPVAAVSA